MADRYPQVMRLVAETPWAVRPEKLMVIQDLMAMRASGIRLTPEEIEARVGPAPKRQAAPSGSVAVIPLYGMILPKASMFSDISGGGGTAIDTLAAAFRAALEDDSIGAILFDVDSPGGSTDMVAEFAAEVRAARGRKPIVAIANTGMASAAYWIGSAADELVVTPSGMVGSIGVFAAHQDLSAAAEMEGVKTTLISAGKHKVEANPFEPLSDEARAAIQQRVDTVYGMFLADVAAGRGLTADVVAQGYGEGRIVLADDAKRLGMVDRVETFDATVQRLIVKAARRPAAATRAFASSAAPLTFTLTEPPGPPMAAKTDSANTEAAESGLSFAQNVAALVAAADQITADTRQLRTVSQEGRLTAAKRDALFALHESLVGSCGALGELLAETDPARHTNAVLREELAFIRSQFA